MRFFENNVNLNLTYYNTLATHFTPEACDVIGGDV